MFRLVSMRSHDLGQAREGQALGAAVACVRPLELVVVDLRVVRAKQAVPGMREVQKKNIGEEGSIKARAWIGKSS